MVIAKTHRDMGAMVVAMEIAMGVMVVMVVDTVKALQTKALLRHQERPEREALPASKTTAPNGHSTFSKTRNMLHITTRSSNSKQHRRHLERPVMLRRPRRQVDLLAVATMQYVALRFCDILRGKITDIPSGTAPSRYVKLWQVHSCVACWSAECCILA